MYRRRRRRFNGRWFPTSTYGQAGGTGTNVIVTATSTGVIWNKGTDVSPIFQGDPDVPNTFAATGSPLAATLGQGSGYLVKRIVGHVDASMLQRPQDDSHAWVALGIYVSRIDNVGNPIEAPNYNIFDDGVTTELDVTQSMMKRWLFRRVWHLGNSASTVAGRNPVFPPYSTGWVTGSNCGSHIDVKVKARVGFEDRLWWQFEIMGGTPPGAVGAGVEVNALIARNVRMYAKPLSYGAR